MLESGTGNATMTLFLSQQLGKNAHLHSYDIKPTQLVEKNYATWKNNYDLTHDFDEKWFSNVKFHQGDVGAIDFDKSFEGYFDCLYFDMAETERAVGNCYRLLKRNGVIVLNTMHLTQIMKTLRTVKNLDLKLETEAIIEPMNRLWKVASIDRERHDELNFVCRVDDDIQETKYLRHYWQGFLVKFRKTE